MTTMKTLALAALLAATPALAAAPPVVVTQAWIRALPGKLPAGGYFTLRNTGARTLTLSGAASPACGMLMLHKSDTAGGMSSMSDVAAVDIAPGDQAGRTSDRHAEIQRRIRRAGEIHGARRERQMSPAS
jgi:hypothetical protein